MDYHWIGKEEFSKRVKKIPDETLTAISGALSGVFSSIIVCPLDVIKTRLQLKLSTLVVNRKVQEYQGFFDTLSKIWNENGIRGFYRGLGPLMIGYLPTWAIYFTIYEHCKTIYSRSYGSQPGKPVLWIVNMKSAITAGIASSILTNPIWIVKTRLMSQNSYSHTYYQNTFDAFQRMYKSEGIFSFYKGLTPSLIGVTHVAIQFPLYELLKDIFFINVSNSNQSLCIKVISASLLSKMIASSITYPHEVIRTRIQTQKHYNDSSKIQYRGIFHTFCRIYNEEGWKSFYSGMGTNLIRAVPASMVTFLTFELVSRWLFRIKHHNEHIN
ncbi:unnamed protein product [Pneumocystis jirovecii]|uniref:Mitochondrial nicotinamide adenine dinucleotide transporter 1 n=2 Tax=Pneumocystis jirovecii TaxID=42068 RepID=L0PFZ5_PNEJI|nr:uncharacterized protein T551_02530 [Pneumocystis jirovecii RU7]KTW28680.1 hypothetical protein T551_02530 [Pneumocystis jirovecii RU7]CCJ31162.1 unnamed protein product [Pneumocystis jirovecii]